MTNSISSTSWQRIIAVWTNSLVSFDTDVYTKLTRWNVQKILFHVVCKRLINSFSQKVLRWFDLLPVALAQLSGMLLDLHSHPAWIYSTYEGKAFVSTSLRAFWKPLTHAICFEDGGVSGYDPPEAWPCRARERLTERLCVGFTSCLKPLTVYELFSMAACFNYRE